jgi:hypothetical protein
MAAQELAGGGGGIGSLCGVVGLIFVELASLTSMKNLMPPRQCPAKLQMNQYFFALLSSI